MVLDKTSNTNGHVSVVQKEILPSQSVLPIEVQRSIFLRYSWEHAQCDTCPRNSESEVSSVEQIIKTVMWNEEIIHAENGEPLLVTGQTIR